DAPLGRFFSLFRGREESARDSSISCRHPMTRRAPALGAARRLGSVRGERPSAGPCTPHSTRSTTMGRVSLGRTPEPTLQEERADRRLTPRAASDRTAPAIVKGWSVVCTYVHHARNAVAALGRQSGDRGGRAIWDARA